MSGFSRVVGSLAGTAAYSALLVPVGLVTLAPAIGSPAGVPDRWSAQAARLIRADGAMVVRRPTRGRALVHTVLSILLGLVAWVALAMVLLLIARGLLYGLVDRGPYDTSWGGPSLAGAWVVHFAIATPIALFGVLLLRWIALLHLRTTRWLIGEAVPWWTLPVAATWCMLAVLLVVAWSRQL